MSWYEESGEENFRSGNEKCVPGRKDEIHPSFLGIENEPGTDGESDTNDRGKSAD